MKTIILSMLVLFLGNEPTIIKKSTYTQITLSTTRPHRSFETIYYFLVQTDSTVKEVIVDKNIFTKFKVGQKFKLQ